MFQSYAEPPNIDTFLNLTEFLTFFKKKKDHQYIIQIESAELLLNLKKKNIV